MKQIAVFLAAGLVSVGLSAAPAHADELPAPTIRAVPSTTAPRTHATTPRQPRAKAPVPRQESRSAFLARVTAKYSNPTIRRPAPLTVAPLTVAPLTVAPLTVARVTAAPVSVARPVATPRAGITRSLRQGAAQAAISAPAAHGTGRRQLTIPAAPRAPSGIRSRVFRATSSEARSRVNDRPLTAGLAAPIVRARATPAPRPIYARTIRPARTPVRVATPITRAQRPARRAVLRPTPARLTRTPPRRAAPKPLTVPRSPTAPNTDTTAPRSLLKPASPGCESG